LTFGAKSRMLKGRRARMPDFNADKKQSTLLVLFIPSADRHGESLGKREQKRWVRKALKVLGENMGGATAFPRGLGVWREGGRGRGLGGGRGGGRDDAGNGELVWDKPVLIQCYTAEETLEQQAAPLRQFLIQMGTQTRQGAVGFVIDRDYYEIQFPLGGGP